MKAENFKQFTQHKRQKDSEHFDPRAFVSACDTVISLYSIMPCFQQGD